MRRENTDPNPARAGTEFNSVVTVVLRNPTSWTDEKGPWNGGLRYIGKK
jgi:hypothetical protein